MRQHSLQIKQQVITVDTEAANAVAPAIQNTYSQYETGEREIPIETFIKLADLYDTSVDYIINLTDEKKPYPRSQNLDS